MALDWSRATVLSTTEFEVSWELLGLGETPVQLDPPSAGRTIEERQRIVAGVAVELRRRGLGDDRGPHPVLAEQMLLLAHADMTLDVRFRRDALVAGVAACRSGRCTLAVRQGSEIAVLSLPAAAAASALVELIGTVTPGPGAQVTIRAGVLDAARAAAPDDPGRFADELRYRGVDLQDAVRLVRMCSGVRQRGQFGAIAHAGSARRHRAPYVVGTHRLDSGDYRQIRLHGTVTICPLSTAVLLDDLTQLTIAAEARYP